MFYCRIMAWSQLAFELETEFHVRPSIRRTPRAPPSESVIHSPTRRLQFWQLCHRLIYACLDSANRTAPSALMLRCLLGLVAHNQCRPRNTAGMNLAHRRLGLRE